MYHNLEVPRPPVIACIECVADLSLSLSLSLSQLGQPGVLTLLWEVGLTSVCVCVCVCVCVGC